MATPFDKILIANRGEIACRVIATCRRLGIATVAVYSEADAAARHVRLADEAVAIGPAPAAQSYLRGEAILAAARATGAQAIHPGYGFLSENATFAETCAEAGLVFIGPSPAAIRAMGDKSAAKQLMQQAGVPLTPGYHGANQDPQWLRAQADAIGYPVLIKASAGGGGKGMRKVQAGADFAAALQSCQREAHNAFGNAHVLVEKYVERPRHIEIQVFGDRHGNLVHLFERDCSVQRRHQKVLEEAPAPGLSAQRRAAMGAAAIEAARAVGYVGAGTVEFIASPDGDFYFMEMNTRLQVEHPVTERITGTDLVEWQLRVAAGEPLPRSQAQLAIDGHAIEARLYAEDADREFLPSTGVLRHLRLPDTGSRVRLDAGVEQGDTISAYYDPMIAKLIVWGEDRDSALKGLRQALAQCEVRGVRSNVAFLQRLLATRAFAEADLDTALIERERAVLFAAPLPPDQFAWSAAALTLLTAQPATRDPLDPYSPWADGDGWRLALPARLNLRLSCQDWQAELVLSPQGRIEAGAGPWQVEINGDPHSLIAAQTEDGWAITLDGHRRSLRVWSDDDGVHLSLPGRELRIQRHDPLAGTDAGHGGDLAAPMPGRIVALSAEDGAVIARGQPLLVLEAMKMEHTVLAPHDGQIIAYRVKPGDLVDEGTLLLDFSAAAA